MKFLIIAAIIFNLPIWAHGQQTMSDSTVLKVVRADSTGSDTTYIRFLTTYQSTVITGSDSLIGKSTSTKRRGLISPMSLPVSTAAINSLATKLNITDTSGMLTAYRNAINGKQATLGFTPYNSTNPSNYIGAADTSAMLTNYRNAINTGVVATSLKVNISDTSGMLTAYRNGLNLGVSTKLNKSDTAAMLLAYQNAINGKQAAGNYLVSGGNAGTPSAIVLTNATGTAAGLTAGNVSTNANLTGDITSVGNATTIGATKVTNAMLAGSIAYSKLSLTGAILNADLAGSIAYSKLSLTGAILNADLAGSIDLTTKVTGILPFANNAGTTASTSATTGTMTVSMVTPIITITPTNACTFNATGGVTAQRLTFVITTSGASSFTLTWGTNFRSTGTLATGTTTAKIFCVSFIYTGSVWVETARTIAQ